jgi:hypothetical protein
MAKRIRTTIGDIFSAKIDENKKKYFQYITSDLTCLNSSVIRAFKTVYPIDAAPSMTEIVKDEVHFYAHCVLRWGLQMNLWEKVGNITDIGTLNHILFRDTNDYGLKKIGEEPIKISDRWYVWHINDTDFTHVGKLKGEHRKAEIGIVVNPYDIICRMKIGKYDFFYPDYE